MLLKPKPAQKLKFVIAPGEPSAGILKSHEPKTSRIYYVMFKVVIFCNMCSIFPPQTDGRVQSISFSEQWSCSLKYQTDRKSLNLLNKREWMVKTVLHFAWHLHKQCLKLSLHICILGYLIKNSL